MWYSTIGVIVTVIAAVIVSYLTGGHKDMHEFNRKLVSPLVRNLLPARSYQSETELKTFETQNNQKIFKNNENGTHHEATKLIENKKI